MSYMFHTIQADKRIPSHMQLCVNLHDKEQWAQPCGICIFTSKYLLKSFLMPIFIISINPLVITFLSIHCIWCLAIMSLFWWVTAFHGHSPCAPSRANHLDTVYINASCSGKCHMFLCCNWSLGIFATEFWQSSLQMQSNRTYVIWNTFFHSVACLLFPQ